MTPSGQQIRVQRCSAMMVTLICLGLVYAFFLLVIASLVYQMHFGNFWFCLLLALPINSVWVVVITYPTCRKGITDYVYYTRILRYGLAREVEELEVRRERLRQQLSEIDTIGTCLVPLRKIFSGREVILEQVYAEQHRLLDNYERELAEFREMRAALQERVTGRWFPCEGLLPTV